MRPGKRDAIIDAALRLLARAGATGFTASALASEAGVSKANIFHHFTSLDAVVLAAFDTAFADIEALAPPQGQTLRDWLLAIGETVLTQAEQQRGLLVIYFVLAGRA